MCVLYTQIATVAETGSQSAFGAVAQAKYFLSDCKYIINKLLHTAFPPHGPFCPDHEYIVPATGALLICVACGICPFDHFLFRASY